MQLQLWVNAVFMAVSIIKLCPIPKSRISRTWTAFHKGTKKYGVVNP